MTDQARIWWTRVALLAGLGWLAIHLILQQAPRKKAVILGRYETGYSVFLLIILIAIAAGAVFVLRPGIRRLVLADRFRPKMIVFAAWLPAGLAIDVLGYTLARTWRAQPEWNTAFAGAYLAATLAVLLVTLDALSVAVRRAEFWMAVMGVIVALGLAEAGMRYWIRNVEDDKQKRLLYDPAVLYTSKLRYKPHHYAGYTPWPGWTSPDGRDRVNSLGFRGEEIELPKPPGIYRIVALGGSTTYDTEVDDWREAYPAQLEQVLREEYGYTNVEVINGGVGGYSSWDTLINLEFRVLDLEPDLVILYQNTNDVHTRVVQPSQYRGDNSGRRKMWDTTDIERATSWPMRFPSVLWRFVGVNLGWLDVESLDLDRVVTKRCTGPTANRSCLGMTIAEALEANPPIYYERNVRNIVAVSRANGVEVLLLTWAYSPEFIPKKNPASTPAYLAAYVEHNAIMQRLADELDTYFYDFALDMPLDREYWVDGRHMTAEGNRVRAELIAAYMEDVSIIPRP